MEHRQKHMDVEWKKKYSVKECLIQLIVYGAKRDASSR
jgi:hypothetical protein